MDARKMDYYVCIVTRRGSGVYCGIPLSPSPEHFAPHSEHGISVIERPEWTEQVRVCFDYPVSEQERTIVLRYLLAVHYPDGRLVTE